MKRSLFAIFLVIPMLAIAQPTGLGLVAQNMMSPVSFISNFIYTACLVIGGSFLFASVIKYIEHRRSPLMVPLSTVIFLLIAGLVLIAFPVLSYITGYGIPFTLF